MKLPIPRFRPVVPPGEISRAFLRAFFSSNAQGPATAEFEKRFAAIIGTSQAAAVPSVRLALYETLKYLKLPAGTEVLCTPITIYPVMDAILAAGCRPVFVDITMDGFSMDLDDAASKLSEKTGAVLATHLWGIPPDMRMIAGFAAAHNLELLEDASQCLGGSAGGIKAGAFGRAGFFSLGATKTLCAYRGAAMVTEDAGLADHMRRVVRESASPSRAYISKWIIAEAVLWLFGNRMFFAVISAPLLGIARKLGRKDWIDNRSLAGNRRKAGPPGFAHVSFSDVQAATALKMLGSLGGHDERRREIARRYMSGIGNLKNVSAGRPVEGSICNRWMFPVFTPDPMALKDFLWRTCRVDTAIPSLDPCHEMEYFQEFMRELPEASRIASQALYLPIYPGLRDDEVERVISGAAAYSEWAGGASVAAGNPVERIARRKPFPGGGLYGLARNTRKSKHVVQVARSLFSFYRCTRNGAPPVIAGWELTADCNCSCPYCDAKSLRGKYGDPDAETDIRIALTIAGSGIGFVNLTGGEPLLSPHLPEVVETLVRGGVRVSLSTNGILLSEHIPFLLKSGIDSVTVGMDSIDPATHDRIKNVHGAFESASAAIMKLRSSPDAGKITIRVRFLLSASNYTEMVNFVMYWRDRVDEVCIQPVQDLGRGHVHHLRGGSFLFGAEMEAGVRDELSRLIAAFPEFDNPYYRGMADFIFQPDRVRNSFRCLIPSLGFIVHPGGDVMLCSDPGITLGNIAGDDLADIWNNSGIMDLRKKSCLLKRDCICWTQQARINFMAPRILPRLIPPSRGKSG